MSRRLWVPGETPASPVPEGYRSLLAREPLPRTEAACACGNPLPWAQVLKTRDSPQHEYELGCACGRKYTAAAGRLWEGSA